MENTNYASNFHYPELEAELEAKNKTILEEVALKAKHFAKKNLPALRGATLLQYVGDFIAKYDEMAEYVKHKIQAGNTAINAQMASHVAQEKIKKLSDRHSDVQNDLYNLEYELEKQGIKLDSIPELAQPKDKKKFLTILTAIGISEIAFNSTALQFSGGDNLLFSIVISIGITLAMFLLAMFLGQHLKKSTGTMMKKAMVTAGATVLALLVIFFLARMRERYLAEETGTEVSIIFLAAVNFLFFAVTTWAYYKNAVSAEEEQQYQSKKKEHDRVMEYKRQLENLKQQAAEAEKEIEQIKHDTAKQLHEILQRPSYAKTLLQRIQIWKIQSIELFKSTNISYRGDHGVPDCFLQTTEPSDHYYQTVST